MIWTKQPIKKEIDELHSKMSRNIDVSSLADLETSIITIASAMSDASTCIGYARLNFTNSMIPIISGMATVNISRRTSGIFITHIMQADGTLVTDYYHDNAHHWGSMKNEITALSSDKVNTSDIVNTLTDISTNKPLSAAQGKALNDKYTSLNSNKIDKPTSVAAGKFLQTDSNGDAVWGNAASPTDVANAVTDWLDDNIPTGQTVVVDQSLTVSGAAADAKKTGDQLSDLKSAIDVEDQKINFTRKWNGVNYLCTESSVKAKSINNQGNLVTAANPRAISTLDYLPIGANETYYVSKENSNTTQNLTVVAFYKSDYTYISRVTNTYTFTTPNDTAYFRVTIDRDGGWPDYIQITKDAIVTTFSPYWKNDSRGIELVDIKGGNIVNKTIPYSKVNDDFANNITNPVFNLLARDVYTTVYSSSNAYYSVDVGTGTVGGPTSNSNFTCKVIDVSDGLPLFYTGKMLGSAHIVMATYLDSELNVIGWNGIYSTSTAVEYTDYMVSPPKNVKYIAFCAYGANLTIMKPSEFCGAYSVADRFVGHNPLPTFSNGYNHIIVYGQSLSNGSDSLYITDPALPGCYMLGTLVTPSAALNPLTVTSGNEHPVISAVNCLHDLIWNNTACKPTLIAGSYGAGGQSIAQLMSPARQAEIKSEMGYSYDITTSGRYQVFLNSLTYGKQVADANGTKISCPVIFFLQGERDYYTDEELSGQPGSVVQAYACGDAKDRYKLYMKRLKDDMQAACVSVYGQEKKPLFAIYEVSGNFVKKHDMGINMAQIEFAEENEDVILLPSPYFVPNYSSAHLATNGYRWYGEFMAKASFQALVQRSDYAPMMAIDPVIDGNNIHLKIRNAYLPLQIDDYTVEAATGDGFAVWADDVRATVTNVSIFGDTITVETSANLSTATKVELSYGGMEVSGTGNIRDSSPFVAMYNYWDDSNDKGQSGSLTISHRPTDKDGNSMIGKKYPMYNWLSSFYNRLK